MKGLTSHTPIAKGSTFRNVGNYSEGAKKSLGQHWLSDDKALEAICDFADVKKGDCVLEIGPGKGDLTTKLLGFGAEVVAVEVDKSLETNLRKKFNSLPFSLNMLSIMDFDLSTLPDGYKVVANIPYYLTSHLLCMLLETQHEPKIIVLLVQKEVAERIAAKPGQMSLLSVSAQFYCTVELGQIIPAKLFTPPPKVDSRIIKLTPRSKPLSPGVDNKEFFHIVKAGFSNRRKTLLNSLSNGLKLSRTETENLLNQADIKSNLRPQELSMNEWHKLFLINMSQNNT